jgi:hypothetical protein
VLWPSGEDLRRQERDGNGMRGCGDVGGRLRQLTTSLPKLTWLRESVETFAPTLISSLARATAEELREKAQRSKSSCDISLRNLHAVGGGPRARLMDTQTPGHLNSRRVVMVDPIDI